MSLKAIGDKVIVIVDDYKATTPSGIVIPTGGTQDDPLYATVVSVGEGVYLKDGTLKPPSLKVGDRVILPRANFPEIKDGGQKYNVVTEANVLAQVV